jgi:hypothetical protein
MRDGGMAMHRARIDGGHGGEADFPELFRSAPILRPPCELSYCCNDS